MQIPVYHHTTVHKFLGCCLFNPVPFHSGFYHYILLTQCVSKFTYKCFIGYLAILLDLLDITRRDGMLHKGQQLQCAGRAWHGVNE